jgi:hypothetical protein
MCGSPHLAKACPKKEGSKQVEEVNSLEDISNISDKEQLVASQAKEIKEFTPVAAEAVLIKDIKEEEVTGPPASEPARTAEGPGAGEVVVAGQLAAQFGGHGLAGDGLQVCPARWSGPWRPTKWTEGGCLFAHLDLDGRGGGVSGGSGDCHAANVEGTAQYVCK